LRTYSTYKELLKAIKGTNTIGLVPTMGSLHDGHLSLIKRAANENNKVIVSIYVNPTQFNDREDLENYPRNLKRDIRKLNKIENLFIYAPDNLDVYDKSEKSKIYDFDGIENIMEGKLRPGHFNGVATIVEKLFTFINPDNAYFGEKDFQQLLLIKILTKQLGLNINIIGCETIRENDGLAMSSRNNLMNNKERKTAGEIVKLLLHAKKMYLDYNINQIKKEIENKAMSIENFKLEYFEIIDFSNFSILKGNRMKSRAFIACKIGKVRLIDNLSL
tara:strand:+ start:6317 stop:7141 length:825 start_codon:yes stop_codon:yes gene_type:complete